MNALAWYYKYTLPRALLIGPAGHGDGEFLEIETVWTPEERRCNAFYMEHEGRCVLAKHGLALAFSDAEAVLPRRIHYTQFQYTPET